MHKVFTNKKLMIIYAALAVSLSIAAYAIAGSLGQATNEPVNARVEPQTTAEDVVLKDENQEDKASTKHTESQQPAVEQPIATQQKTTTVSTDEGSVISYSESKQHTLYQGGSIVVSPSNLKYVQGTDMPLITVSSSNGQKIPMPHDPWDSKSPYGVAVVDPDAGSLKSSWSLAVNVVDAPVGSHSMEIVSYVSDSDNNSHEYRGVINVEVVAPTE